MLKNKKMIKTICLTLLLSLCTPILLATKSFGNEYDINYGFENGLYEEIDEFYDLNTSNNSYEKEVGSFEDYYGDINDEVIDFDINYDFENDYNYEDYYNPGNNNEDFENDYDYDYNTGNNNNNNDYNYNDYDDYYDFTDFDFGGNNNSNLNNYYNPYTPDDFSFMDNIYDDYWGYEKEEEHVPGSKFLKTKNTIQYTLNMDDKYPIYIDTGIEVVDGVISLEGLREVLSQIAIKKNAKLIEDSDKFMVLIDEELLIIRGNIENEKSIEELFEKTSVKIKIQPTRAGGKFNLADYIEVNGNIPVKVNEEFIELITEPIMDNSRILFPIRSIATAMNAKVEWNDEKYEAIITKDDKVIKSTLDSDIVTVNGVEYIINNKTKLNSEKERILSVIRLIVTELDGTMEWDSTNSILVIETPQEKVDLDKDF